MFHKRCATVFGISGLLLACGVANATTVRKMGIPELVQKSTTVVQGTVTATEVVYDNGPNGPANVRTIATIQVAEVIKGQPVDTVQVAGFGGQVGEFLYKWPGIPQFEVGQETIVMLHKPVAQIDGKPSLFAPLGQDGMLMVTGFEQGRFKVEPNDAGQMEVIQSADGLEFVSDHEEDGKVVRKDLATFVAEVNGVVANQRANVEQAKNKETD